MFRNDPYHSGKYGGNPVVNEPSVVWTFNARGKISGSPVVSGNRLFIGDGEGFLYALDIRTGKEIWHFKADKIHSTPLVYRENIFFMSSDGIFYAVNTISGKSAWTFRTEGEKRFEAPGIYGLTPKDSLMVDDWDIYLSSRAAHNELIFFGTGSGFVYALNAIDGSEVWKFRTGNVVHSSPVVTSQIAYFGSFNGTLYAIDLENEKIAWNFTGNAARKDSLDFLNDDLSFKLERIFEEPTIKGMKAAMDKLMSVGPVLSTPAIHDGIVFFAGADGTVYVLK